MRSLSESSIYKLKFIAAFAAVYIVWGSTYLAIKIAIKTLPPLMSGGIRFLIAGVILFIYKSIYKGEKPTARHWVSAFIAGSLFFLIANGTVILGMKYIDSSIAAILVALTPAWMVLFDQLHANRHKPGPLTLLGIAISFVGVVILFNPFHLLSQEHMHIAGAVTIMSGSMCWAAGTIYLRVAKLPDSKGLAASMQMITGGSLLLIASVLAGETNSIHPENFSLESLIALLYLIVFGSIVAFSAYNWLLTIVSPAMIGTTAYVNPIVAIVLGIFIAGESIQLNGIIASAIILSGVIMISREASLQSKTI